MTQALTSETKAPDTKENNVNALLNWILRLVPAIIVGRAALMKFTGAAGAVALFTELGMEPNGRILIGLLEMGGVLVLLTPRISAWGAVLCLGVLTGAIIAHVTVLGFDGAQGTLFVMAIVAITCLLALLYRLREQIPFIASMFAK